MILFPFFKKNNYPVMNVWMSISENIIPYCLICNHKLPRRCSQRHCYPTAKLVLLLYLNDCKIHSFQV